MRRLFSVALIGLAVAAAASNASAQGRPGGRGRGGVADTARMRVRDSIRVARGDTAFGRRGPDSLRQHRIDSLRAAGVLDSNRMGRGGPGRGRGMGPMGGRGGALMGLQLNDNEKSAIKTINEKYRAEYDQLRDANQGAGRGRNPEMAKQAQAIAEREQAEIRAALTAANQARFDANVAKRKEMGAQRPGGRRPPRPPALPVR